jgi:hypothetical protein
MNLRFRKADVVIAGGGVAGVAAGIAAAREGADTLIVERYGFLGGMFTGGNMSVLAVPPIGGIWKEVVDRLMKIGGARYCPDDPANYPIFHNSDESSIYTIPYDNEMAKWVLDEMANVAGVKLQLHTFITGALTEGGTVRGITAVSKSGLMIIEGNIVIDATADGDVAASAGAAFLKGHPDDPEKKLLAMTMPVRLSNVDWHKVSDYSKRDPGLKNTIRKAIANGDLPYYKARTGDMPDYWGHDHPELSYWVTEDGAILWGGTVEGVDGTNVDDLTRAEIEARKQYLSELAFLKKHVPGFENARVESTGASIGVRETRHIVGEYVLTGKDVLEGNTFPDVVTYGIGYGGVAEIPYRCLVPKMVDNLLMCGDCISVVPGSTFGGTRLGSYNNFKDMPTMAMTGEAAGTAAALCARTGAQPRGVDVSALQQKLRDQGVLVAPDVLRTYLDRRLPSGITMGEYLERRRRREIERWKKLGQL